MPPQAALFVCAVLIAGLFLRDQKNHPGLSLALWIPLIWIFIIGSRSFSAWIHLGSVQLSTIDGYAEGSSLDRNFLLLMFAVATVVVLRRKLQWSSLFRQNRLIFGFVLFCLISVVWSEFPLIAIKRFVRFLGVLPMVLLVLTEESPREAVASVIRRCSYLFRHALGPFRPVLSPSRAVLQPVDI